MTAPHWPRAMTPGTTSRQIILSLAAAIAGSAIGGVLHYVGCPGDIEIYHKAGAFGGAMLAIATGVYRW